MRRHPTPDEPTATGTATTATRRGAAPRAAVDSPALWIGVMLILSAPVFAIGWTLFGGPADGGAFCAGSDDCRGIRFVIGLIGAAVLCVLGTPMVLIGAGRAGRRRRRGHRAPAGWYRDPAGEAGHRYWNGVAWTEHTQP